MKNVINIQHLRQTTDIFYIRINLFFWNQYASGKACFSRKVSSSERQEYIIRFL